MKLSNQCSGVYIENAESNAVGGLSRESGNVISANNGPGVTIAGADAKSNQVLNNYVGTGKDGSGSGLGNGAGVVMWREKTASAGRLIQPGARGKRIAGNRVLAADPEIRMQVLSPPLARTLCKGILSDRTWMAVRWATVPLES